MAKYIDADSLKITMVFNPKLGHLTVPEMRDILEEIDSAPAADVEKWIPVTERLPECEVGAEIGNVEWISHDMVFAGCFGHGGKYRDAYFRTWTDTTEGINAKDADYWRVVTLPEPPKGERHDRKNYRCEKNRH